MLLQCAALNAHPSLGLLCLPEFELQLLEFGLCTTKLTQLLVVVHLLDLVVLELLLIYLLLVVDCVDNLLLDGGVQGVSVRLVQTW